MSRSFVVLLSGLAFATGLAVSSSSSPVAAQVALCEPDVCNSCRASCGTWEGCTTGCPPWDTDGGACINQCQQALNQCWASCPGCDGCAGSAY